MLRERERKVLIELLKDGRKPDKHIANDLRMTQPTVTRIRQKLEKTGMIRSYRPVVSEKKLGFTITVLTFFIWHDSSETKEIKECIDYIVRHPHVTYFAEGEGLRGKNAVILSLHIDFADYENFMHELREKFGKHIYGFEQFVHSMDAIAKHDRAHTLIHGISKLP
ncbi:MAG: Lrp/AsnC family transcriptional regulator, partial [Candidatus Aenigmatarchaeota archaeon]